MLHRTGDENNDFFFSEQVLDFIKMVAVDGRSKNRIPPRKVFHIRNEYCTYIGYMGSPTKKKRVNLGIAQKGGWVETLAQIVFGSSSVNINHY